MAGRYNFVSPGAAAGDALQQFLLERDRRRRQQVEEELRRQQEERLQQQMELQAKDREIAAEDRRNAQGNLEHERDFRRATTVATVGLPGLLDERTAESLDKHGYGTLQERYGAGSREYLGTDETGADQFSGAAPGIINFKGGINYQNRVESEKARAALAEQQAAARAESEREKAREAAEREKDRQIWQGSQNDLTRAITKQGVDARTSAAEAKTAQAARETADKQQALANARAEVRNLAQELIDDPNLADITGSIEGRLPGFLTEDNQRAMAKFTQLKNKLALGEREKLKGQGAISNFEAQQLASAVSALDRATGHENTIEMLKQIQAAFAGDSPSAAPVPGTERNPLPAVPPRGGGPGAVGNRFTIVPRP
jgi:hypothetical protein